MITNHTDARDFHRAPNIGSEFFCFFGESVLGEVSAQQQHVCVARNLGKRIVHFSPRMLGVVKVCGRGDTQRSFSHRFKKRNGDEGWTFRMSNAAGHARVTRSQSVIEE
jgi:hypothetical protein